MGELEDINRGAKMLSELQSGFNDVGQEITSETARQIMGVLENNDIMTDEDFQKFIRQAALIWLLSKNHEGISNKTPEGLASEIRLDQPYPKSSMLRELKRLENGESFADQRDENNTRERFILACMQKLTYGTSKKNLSKAMGVPYSMLNNFSKKGWGEGRLGVIQPSSKLITAFRNYIEEHF